VDGRWPFASGKMLAGKVGQWRNGRRPQKPQRQLLDCADVDVGDGQPKVVVAVEVRPNAGKRELWIEKGQINLRGLVYSTSNFA
jgi:hypothetical protein